MANMILFCNYNSFTKRVIVTFSISLYCLFASATLTQSHVSIIVSESYCDAKATSKQSIDNQQRLHLYNDGDCLLFANEWLKENTKSYGRIYDITIDTNIIHFKWMWMNSYDDKTGIADVYINNLNYSSCRVVIITDNMMVLDYRGTCNGSIKQLFLQNSSVVHKPRNDNKRISTIKQENKTPILKKKK